MQKNQDHFLLLKKLKNAESAQLWEWGLTIVFRGTSSHFKNQLSNEQSRLISAEGAKIKNLSI